MFHRKVLLGALLCLSAVLGVSAAGGATKPVVGGACAYKQYEGHAQITSVIENVSPNNGSYVVKFLFFPNQTVSEAYAQTAGKEFLLQTGRGSQPSAAYVQQNGIEAGKEFDCVLHVIVKGTCTPMIFLFPSFKD